MNRAKAVKDKCLECSGNSPKEVTLCHIVTCPLWSYRFGYTVGNGKLNSYCNGKQFSYGNGKQKSHQDGK